MRFTPAAIVALLLLAPATAGAQGDAPPPSTRETGPAAAAEETLTREQRLDRLFQTLTTSTDQSAAQSAEREILSIWLESGSDTVDLLMNWALEAMARKEFPLALDYLDRVTTLEPTYVEGWNKRATVFFLVDDYGKALTDLERVLAIEPRHFGALAGLGAIFRDLGNEEQALAAYREALKYDPYMDGVKKAVGDLEKKGVGGRSL
jgi:tetratricopeptide (TPR) repeat protein